jgi:hypothetical protein
VADTKQLMDAAIEAHFAETCEGALVTGYVLQVFGNSVVDLEDESIRTLREVAEGQNFITTLGIADYVSQGVRRSISLTEWDPDDE